MIRFRLRRLSAAMLAILGSGTVFAAFLLAFPAAAQSVPAGYVASREGDVIVMRPSAAADPDVAIRVYPPIADNRDPAIVRRGWAELHAPAGVNPSALIYQDKTTNGVSALFRIWMAGTQAQVELIMLPRAGAGRYRPVLARVPSQPGPLLTSHTQAMARVVALILAGQFQPNVVPEAKGSAAVAAAPAEPASKGTGPGRTAPAPAATVPAASAQGQATKEQLARSTTEIEAVGFITRAEMGVGGMFLYLPKPVALFRSGDALLDMGNLNRVTSVEADRAAHPGEWGRWRRTAGGIEVSERDKWKKLDYPKTGQRLPAGFVLSGDFERMTGGGDSAVGGKNTVMSYSRFTFRPDGKFSCNRLTTADSTVVDYHTFVSTGNRLTEGRYHVDGYLLTLEPAGGQPETHLIATYPGDPTIIWIDGRGYTRPTK